MFYEIIRPLLFSHDSEKIHDRVLGILKIGAKIPNLYPLIRAMYTVRDERLGQTLFGLHFPNPVGLAAGMDKMGVALRGFEAMGFGFLEMGGITAERQDGNEKPRIFRLPEDLALINRMGFNNWGATETARHLSDTRLPKVPLGINLGKSKATPVDDMPAVIADYCKTFRALYRYASFFVVNVSSPNTPGLRGLQGPEFLEALLLGIQKEDLRMLRKPRERVKPILLKIAPDLTQQEVYDIVRVVLKLGIDGVVATNTTVKRDSLKTTGSVVDEVGGLSGKPLFNRALALVRYIHEQAPELPIIGVGGIFSAKDAYRMIGAGASLVQIYTGLVYEGPGFIRQINRGLLASMEQNSVSSIGGLNPFVNRQ